VTVPASQPSGPIAYATPQVRVREDGNTRILVTGCVVNPDGTLARVGESQAYLFDVSVPVTYGMGAAELAGEVTAALEDAWGVTGLADVKFIPAF